MTKPVNQYLFSRKTLVLVSLLAGWALTAAYDPLNWHFLAALMPGVLYFFTLRRFDKGLLFYGALFAMAHFFTSFSWLSTIEPLAYLNPFLMALAWLPHIALWLWLTRKFHAFLVFPQAGEPRSEAGPDRFVLSLPRQLLLVVVSCSFWCLQEWFRTWFWTGFPWNLLGYSQAYQPGVRTIASSFGVLGVSFFLMSLNMALATIGEQAYWKSFCEGQKKWQLKSLLLFVPAVLIFFFAQVMKVENTPDSEFNVTMVQGCYMPSLTKALTEAERQELLRRYRNLSREYYQDGKTDLLIWPETALPYLYHYHYEYYSLVQDLLKEGKGPIMLGSSHLTKDRERYNSAFLIDQDGKEQRYDKIHIVPYGEYTPFKDYLSPELHDKMNKMIGMGPSLSEGREYRLLKLKGVPFGVNICFEDVFPQNSVIYANKGAKFLLTLTNDAWFKESVGGQQHTAHAVFRSIETALPSLRSGNHSESCVVLPDGEIVDLMVDAKTGSRFSMGAQNIIFPYASQPKATFYQGFPNILLFFIELISLLSILVLFLQYLKKKSTFADAIKK